LGCGLSDNPNDTAYWDLPRFVEEVEQVRKALGLNKDNFYLLGHSWGGILAMQYALKYQDQMKALVISNMMSSCPDYGKYADKVLSKQFDKTVLDSLMAMEARNDFANPNYMGLLIPNFYEKHILRLPSTQWPEPVSRSLGKMNQSLYVTMQGPSEFGIAGRLTSWDVSKELSKIQIPTLVVGAQHDTMDPEHMKWMASQLKKGTYLYCENGSHMSMYDDQQTYFKGLIGFVKSVENQ
jgi:proline iminopeptidase